MADTLNWTCVRQGFVGFFSALTTRAVALSESKYLSLKTGMLAALLPSTAFIWGCAADVAFVTERDGHGQIYKMNRSGNSQTNISNTPETDHYPDLAVVIDLCSRKVVGWSMSSRMKAQLVCDALKMAIWRRRPTAGLIHHSDRGSQYASKAFRRLLKAHGFKGSMSRKGDCWDNAVVESFFGSLKQERVQWRSYQTRYEAQQDILEYISMFYNSYRLHSCLGYTSPNDFEEQLLMNRKKAA